MPPAIIWEPVRAGFAAGGDFAAAAGKGAGERGVGEGFVERGGNYGVVQYVCRAGSEDETFSGSWKSCGFSVENGRLPGHRRGHQIRGDDGEFVQPHGFHGAGGGADIGGMAGAGEDDADVAEIVGQFGLG